MAINLIQEQVWSLKYQYFLPLYKMMTVKI